MYKKSLRSMPRSIKREVVKKVKFIKSLDDIIPISQSECASDEKYIVDLLSTIQGLPSYWLISSKDENDLYFIVFETLLNKELEEKIISNSYLEDYLYDESYSPYYGIY